MYIEDIKKDIPPSLFNILASEIKELRPAQEKAIRKGVLDGKNVLVCTPTASGKTLIAELACLKAIVERMAKAVYIVPLRALASEKYKDFTNRYKGVCKVALSSGDIDSDDSYLVNYDLIITTSEKLDSLIRHHASWINQIGVIVVDEIHLLNDTGRGPTLEVLLTILRQIVNAQIVALSATVGNPEELAAWLDAELVEDDWRPVELKKGIYRDDKVRFY